MNVAIFGGRFDPIHNGHLTVAKEILKSGKADEVWMSIENQHQWRPIVASAECRIEMMHLAIQSECNIKIDTTPIELGGLTETITVMREIRSKSPENTYFFVCGSDQPFSKWTHWEELEKEVTFLIVPRKGSSLDIIPTNCIILDDLTYEPVDDSATRIRNLLQEGKPITGLVPSAVEKYILEKGLYK